MIDEVKSNVLFAVTLKMTFYQEVVYWTDLLIYW